MVPYTSRPDLPRLLIRWEIEDTMSNKRNAVRDFPPARKNGRGRRDQSRRDRTTGETLCGRNNDTESMNELVKEIAKYGGRRRQL